MAGKRSVHKRAHGGWCGTLRGATHFIGVVMQRTAHGEEGADPGLDAVATNE